MERCGFCEVSFIKARSPSYRFQRFYNGYLKKKFHGDMAYLENIPSKLNLKHFWSHGIHKATKKEPGSMMVALYPYRHIKTEQQMKKSPYKIARYAWGVDYHGYLKEKLKKALKGDPYHQIVIDSTPLPERYYARRAGLGFIGKNAMLINPRMGSYFFLVFVLFDQKISWLNLSALQKKTNHMREVKPGGTPRGDISEWCSECNLCVRSCPTNALPGNGELNANQCISYWNIESRSKEMDREHLKKGKWIFGCDICQKVCPYNKNSVFTLDQNFAPHDTAVKVSMGECEDLTSRALKGLPLERAGLKKLRRNLRFWG